MQLMEAKTIFYPVLAQVFFTLLIGIWVAILRITHMRRNRIHPQQLADGSRWDELLRDVENPSDAFENLFEVPVLFYTVAISIYTTGMTDTVFVSLAWTFVLCRVAQGLIHSTYNRIMHRAVSFWLGSLVIFAIWVRFAIQIIWSK
jgi:hypothetical protein